MVAAYDASGLSMAAFAAQHGLQTQRVSYWRSRVLSSRRESGSKGFAAVSVVEGSESVVEGAEAPAMDEQVLEVSLRGGRSMRIRGPWSNASIKTWVHALETVS